MERGAKLEHKGSAMEPYSGHRSGAYPPVGSTVVMSCGDKVFVWPFEDNEQGCFTGWALGLCSARGLSTLWLISEIERVERSNTRKEMK